MQRKRARMARTICALALAGATLWGVGATAKAQDAAGALKALKAGGEVGLALLRLERGDEALRDVSVQAAMALRMTPLLRSAGTESTQVWSSELTLPPEAGRDTQDDEGTVLSQTAPPTEQTVTDNGVPSRTLKASDPAGYTVFGNVYINNGSSAALDETMLSRDYAAQLGAEEPQVLIIHTHGTESYTMPAGEEYEPSDSFRTLDLSCNMIRIGDEIAQVLEEAGIGVVHDRTLYDYPSYSGSYDRSRAGIERCLAEYPTIAFVLDVHRDAVQDAEGNQYKLLCGEDSNAAQIEFVIGSNGGGLSHERWRENLKLACAVQETLYADYPTLMRPIVVRSSRYNQQLTTGSLLVEVGTAGNSLAEAVNAARLFAAGFAETLQNEQ